MNYDKTIRLGNSIIVISTITKLELCSHTEEKFFEKNNTTWYIVIYFSGTYLRYFCESEKHANEVIDTIRKKIDF